MNGKKPAGDGVAGGRSLHSPRSRWTGDRLLYLGVGILLCGYAVVSMLLSR